MDSEEEQSDTSLVEDEDDYEDDLNGVEEVFVDDSNVPMDDDDDDDENGDNGDGGASEAIHDMSQVQLTVHTDHVYTVAACLDAGVMSILSGAGDDMAYLHKRRIMSAAAADTESKRLPHNHTDSVSCVAFNHPYRTAEDDNTTPKLSAVGAYDGSIIIYESDTGNTFVELEGPSDVEWLAWHPKGGTVLLAGSMADGTIWMYHVLMKKCLQVFCGHVSGVTSGAFTLDGKWALSASQDGTLKLWAPRTGVCKHTFQTGTAGLLCMAIGGGADGQLVMVGAEDGAAHVCHVGTKKIVTTLKHFEAPLGNVDEEDMELPMSVEAVAFCVSNPLWCATGGVDGVLKIWDLASGGGHCRQQCKTANDDDSTGGITRIVWHPTVPLVFSSYSDGCVRLWDARNGRLLTTLTGNTDMINDMVVCFVDSENAVVVSASDDKTVRIFDIDIGAIMRTQLQQQ